MPLSSLTLTAQPVHLPTPAGGLAATCQPVASPTASLGLVTLRPELRQFRDGGQRWGLPSPNSLLMRKVGPSVTATPSLWVGHTVYPRQEGFLRETMK